MTGKACRRILPNHFQSFQYSLCWSDVFPIREVRKLPCTWWHPVCEQKNGTDTHSIACLRGCYYFLTCWNAARAGRRRNNHNSCMVITCYNAPSCYHFLTPCHLPSFSQFYEYFSKSRWPHFARGKLEWMMGSN